MKSNDNLETYLAATNPDGPAPMTAMLFARSDNMSDVAASKSPMVSGNIYDAAGNLENVA